MKNKDQPTYSIILPLYNQFDSVERIFNTYYNCLYDLEDTWELIFVCNGKTDGTAELLRKISENKSGIKILTSLDEGWGRAVKMGMSAAVGKYICYTNSARTNILDLITILKYGKVNDDVVIKATRIIREKFIRKIGSILFNFENRFLFKTPVWDVNGTPKLIPRKILDRITIVSDFDLIDAEVIAKCYIKNIPIIEIPVYHDKRISGKSTTNIISALKMYIGIYRLKKEIMRNE